MEALFYVLGPLLVAAAAVDAVWTTFWVDGGSGPITTRLTTWLWRVWRAIAGRRRHRALSLAGPTILLATALTWLLLMGAGWTLLFAADEGSLANTRDGGGAGWSGRAWYVAYTMFTVGNGDFSPRGPGWRVVSSLVAFTGLIVATLAVTYLLSVLSAVVQKRSFAGHIAGIGRSPEDFVLRTWTGRGFGSIELQLNALVVQLGTLTHQHLAYPVLHYYHAARSEASSAVSIVILDEALTLIECGVEASSRPDEAVLRSARESVGSYLETLARAFIDPAERTPPPPNVSRLREAGVPTVSEERFDAALEERSTRRRRLLGMVTNDAWGWPPVEA